MKVYNPDLKKSIVDELYYLDNTYFQLDKPIPFKDGLTIYPVNVQYYNEFLSSTACLTLNRLESIEGIETNNLGYLLLKVKDEKEGVMWSTYLSKLCELVFHIKDGVRCKKCGKVMSYIDFVNAAQKAQENNEKEVFCECGSSDLEGVITYRLNNENKQYELIVNGVTITSDDFDRFREIVMYQNLPDYKDDSWVDPDVREDQQEKQRLLAKKNKTGNATLERKIICVGAKTGYTIDYIMGLSIRKFLILLSAVDDLITYETTRIGLMMGMVSTKEPLEHWIYKRESEDLYGGATTTEDMQNKLSGNG